jgi:hypothetical protein
LRAARKHIIIVPGVGSAILFIIAIRIKKLIMTQIIIGLGGQNMKMIHGGIITRTIPDPVIPYSKAAKKLFMTITGGGWDIKNRQFSFVGRFVALYKILSDFRHL